MDHHPTLSPSKADILVACPCFNSLPESEDAAEGTRQHELLTEAFRRGALMGFEPPAVVWAFEWLMAHCDRETTLTEERLAYVDPETFEERYFGTADFLQEQRRFIIDFKSGEERSHVYQGSLYTLPAMQRLGVEAFGFTVLNGRYRTVDSVMITRAEALERLAEVQAIIDLRAEGKAEPTPCEFCSWCANAPTCPALHQVATRIARGRGAVELPTYHPSEITDPGVMAQALELREYAKAFAESVHHHAKEMASRGIKIPGWKFIQKKGPQFITDILRGFELTGLAPDEFIIAATVSLDKLAEVFTVRDNMTKTAAARHVQELLAPVLDRKPSIPDFRRARKTKGTPDAETDD